ncbi:MAG: hypothetical protein ACEPOV_01425 [Hyphomicrobiales bacterium]
MSTKKMCDRKDPDTVKKPKFECKKCGQTSTGKKELCKPHEIH